MTEVAFYHLTQATLEEVLPKLLEKTLQAGKRALVMAGSKARVEALNGALWAYDTAAWLPHGSVQDGQAEKQPVWLTDQDENPNQAEFAFLADGVVCADLSVYERCFEVFDGHNAKAVETARAHWILYKDKGFDLAYWQQTDSGGWRKKEM